MDIQAKIDLVKRKPVEETVTEEDLKRIFENHAHPKHYIGFEISGMVHIGSGLCTMLKINDFLKAGIKPTIFLADYHAWINGKLGGDLPKIQAIAEGYFKHAFISLGLTEDKVDYVLASKIYDQDYWRDVMKISKDTTIKRMLRCITIMGRSESDSTSSAAILYPAMQAADIFKLGVQIAHAGTDQRKVHMLARELLPVFGNPDFCAVHGHLLPGLYGGERMDPLEAKMSKSKPDSAIFIHDSEEEIRRKIKKAYCPEKAVEGNPMIEYAEYLIMRDKPLKIERPEKFGGDVEFTTPEELKTAYSEGKLHPMDLKAGVGEELVRMLKPSRDYFAKHADYLEQIKTVQVTR